MESKEEMQILKLLESVSTSYPIQIEFHEVNFRKS